MEESVSGRTSLESAVRELADELRYETKRAIRLGLLKCRVYHDDLEWMTDRIEPQVSHSVLSKLAQFFFDICRQLGD